MKTKLNKIKTNKQTNEGIDNFAVFQTFSALVHNGSFNPFRDVLVVIAVSAHNAVVCGCIRA